MNYLCGVLIILSHIFTINQKLFSEMLKTCYTRITVIKIINISLRLCEAECAHTLLYVAEIVMQQYIHDNLLSLVHNFTVLGVYYCAQQWSRTTVPQFRGSPGLGSPAILECDIASIFHFSRYFSFLLSL